MIILVYSGRSEDSEAAIYEARLTTNLDTKIYVISVNQQQAFESEISQISYEGYEYLFLDDTKALASNEVTVYRDVFCSLVPISNVPISNVRESKHSYKPTNTQFDMHMLFLYKNV